ncbi:MAG: hypothetical protein ACQEWV_27720 [Bacillota bacterium]
MIENQIKTPNVKKWEHEVSGFKVIELKLSDSTESLYAVVTPIKNMK